MSLYSFYRSKEWEAFRQVVIMERLVDGETICEYCHKPIVKPYDLILHHIKYLTENNYTDTAISLNPDNIQLVHHRCHNLIHEKGYKNTPRQVYVVYGAPLSGKTSYVAAAMRAGDLLIDMDNIWQCISGQPRYIKPNRLKANVFGVRDKLLEQVRYRVGSWNNAYVIGGYPYRAERERLIDSLGAKEIFIDADRQTCLARLDEDSRNKEEWQQYIDDWFGIYEGGY